MGPRGADSSKRYSLKNFNLCEHLHQELHNVAVKRICGDMLKMLLGSRDRKFVQARNRMDIPHGLFGLKLSDFYERRKRDTVYLDVLQLVCPETMQQAKTCIVLDDLVEFIRNILAGHLKGDMEPIKKEIANSTTLLTISEVFTEKYRITKVLLRKANHDLDEFHAHEKMHLNRMKNQAYSALNNYMESLLVLNTLEYRTHVNYLNRKTEQYLYEMSAAEEHLKTNLDNIYWGLRKEESVNDSSILRQNMEINFLKKKLVAMSKEYDKQMEYYDGEIAYNSNMIDIMRTRLIDCAEKLPYFDVEMQRLRLWEYELEMKKHEQARALITAKPKKRKAKPQDVKGVMTKRR